MHDSPGNSRKDWDHWIKQWRLRAGTIYLNHGSFGPCAEPVRAVRQRWCDELDEQPMDFFFRLLEPAWRNALAEVAQFIGAQSDNLVFVDNATYAMNVVARSFPLVAGDEVLLTDHEYGAVVRIWRRACEEAGAAEPVIAKLPWPVATVSQIVEAVMSRVTDRTRLLVVSHITSPTACILPVRELCRAARDRGLTVVIDGPHAIAHLPLDIESLDCDFYTISCHKWLSAPFGSGLLYVAPRHQARIRPPILSWGRLPPDMPASWTHEFPWLGTRDPSPFLTVPAAMRFLEEVGWEAFRKHTHELANQARRRITELTQLAPPTPDSRQWYGSMVCLPLPDGDAKTLQDALWQRFGIEVPIVPFANRRWIRVSCHLYNTPEHIDQLIAALKLLL
jgi:isopenicillin-N epimerase